MLCFTACTLTNVASLISNKRCLYVSFSNLVHCCRPWCLSRSSVVFFMILWIYFKKQRSWKTNIIIMLLHQQPIWWENILPCYSCGVLPTYCVRATRMSQTDTAYTFLRRNRGDTKKRRMSVAMRRTKSSETLWHLETRPKLYTVAWNDVFKCCCIKESTWQRSVCWL